MVNLEKGSSGLGFSVQGGVGYHEDVDQCVVRIRKVYPVGPAADSGKLREGDVLLQVDGHPLKHLSHQVSRTAHTQILYNIRLGEFEASAPQQHQ